MEDSKRILIIDEDQSLIIKLKDKLLPLGHKVTTAINGVIALQKILNSPPDLIIMEVNLGIISGEKIAQIIRANPKISGIPFFFLSNQSVEIPTFDKSKDIFILKPFNFDEVASKVSSHFNKLEGKQPGKEKITSEISGHLSQISLPDLLQIFHMNKKNGRLIIKYKDKNGIIFIKKGDVINAQIDNVEGEKAFFRLMSLKEERFNFLPEEFLPEDSTTIPKINIKPDNLLMEGLRQLDEWEEMKDNLPDLNSTLKLKIDPASISIEVKPINQEIFVLMDFYSKVKDIVDGCSFSDFEVLKSLYNLLQKGIIEEISSKKSAAEKANFLTPEQLMKIKKRLIETKSFRVNKKYEKILVMGESFGTLKKLVQMFLLLKEFSINQKDIISSPDVEFLGILGRLKLTEEMNILFYSIPIRDSYKPLWNSISKDVIGTLLLMPQNGSTSKEDIKGAYGFFKNSLEKPIKPILISNNEMDDSAVKKIETEYSVDKIFNYNINDKEGVRDFFVNLLVEIL